MAAVTKTGYRNTKRILKFVLKYSEIDEVKSKR
jgi:hypothetical protein